MNRSSGGFWRYNGSSKPIPSILVLGMSAWRNTKHRQYFGMQGEKGGDFLGAFLKKYYPNLAWRKPLYRYHTDKKPY